MDQRSHATSPDGADDSASRGMILFVDDEEAIVFVATAMLKKLGFDAAAYTDSRAALEEFRSRPDEFIALFTDQTMPGLTGAELTEAVRELRPEIPIILSSGYAHPDNAHMGEDSNVVWLKKPFGFSELRAAVDEALA